MALTSVDDVIDAVSNTMGAVAAKLSSDAKEQSVNMALSELHWTLPITDSQKELWTIERSKRYMISVLLVESADKFQYKKIYLHHRFSQYFKLLEFMDSEFAKALENDSDLFDVGVYSNLTDYITNGFNYDAFGYDHGYSGWL